MYPDSPNPGAAEIAVYPTPLTAAQLAELQIPATEKTAEALALRRDLIAGRFGFREMLLVKRKPLDISHVYVYHVEGYRPGGGLYVFTPGEDGGQLRCIFDAGQGMITTADLSYDGREIVFALRRGGHVASNPMAHIEDISRYAEEASNYQLFRMNIDGTRAGATDTRRAQQPRPVLAARRRYRLHVGPKAGLRLLLGHDFAGPLPHGTRRLEAEAAVGELPDGFHALGAQQRPDHLHPLGIR